MLLIDSNQYLNLYKTPRGKQLLAPLKEVKAHIFSTQQIADEVRRNKLKIAGAFLRGSDKTRWRVVCGSAG